MKSFQRLAAQVLDSGMPLWEAEKRFRDAVELEALNRTKGHQLKAAALLGIHRNTLGRKLDGTALRRKRNGTVGRAPSAPGVRKQPEVGPVLLLATVQRVARG